MANEIMKIDPMTGEIVPQSQMIGIEESRATAESQAGFIMAKQFPRDIEYRRQNIIKACTSVRLAEEAEYSYPKGKTEVRGPTIKLLEAIAQEWGNLLSGIRELETGEDESVLMSYCYDLETNRREERIFTVRHEIQLKGGAMKKLTDPREVYEHKFNLAARRKRACMEGVIPRWLVDEAVDACRETMRTSGMDPNEENIADMLKAFEEFSITEDMVETRYQKKIKAITGPEFAQLKRIYKSLNDGMSTADHWFDDTIKEPQRKTEEKKTTAKKKAPPKKKAAKPKTEPEADSDPERPTATETVSVVGAPPKDEGDPGPEEPGSEATGTASLPLEEEEKTKPSNPTMTDRVEKVEFINEGKSPQGNPYSLYHVYLSGGTRLSCFDKEVIEKAEEAVEDGVLCEIEYHKKDKYMNIIGIEVIG